MPLDKYGLKFNPFSAEGSAESEVQELQEILVNYEDIVNVVHEAVTRLQPPLMMLIANKGTGRTKILRYMEKHFQKMLPQVFTTYITLPPVKEPIDLSRLIFQVLLDKTPERLKKILSGKVGELEEKGYRMPYAIAEQIVNELEAKVGRLEEGLKVELLKILKGDIPSFTSSLTSFIKEFLSLIFNVNRCLLLIDQFENYVSAVKRDDRLLAYLHEILEELSQRFSEDGIGVIVLTISSEAFSLLQEVEEKRSFMAKWERTKAFQYIKGLMSSGQVKELIVKYCEIAKGKKPEKVSSLSGKEIDQIIEKGESPFNREAIDLIWTITYGFPRNVVKLAHQALENVETGKYEMANEECVMHTLYAKENYQPEAFKKLQDYIRTACECGAKNARLLIENLMEKYAISIEEASLLLNPKDLQAGRESLNRLLEEELLEQVAGKKICLSKEILQGLYTPPLELPKPSIPLPSPPSISKIKEGFIYALNYFLKETYPLTLLETGDKYPWAVVSFKDVNISWRALIYFFGCEEERECSLHLEEARRLLIDKNCHLIFGLGLMSKDDIYKLASEKQGYFSEFSASTSTMLSEQLIYIPVTMKDLGSFYAIASTGDRRKERIIRSISVKKELEKIKKPIGEVLSRLMEKMRESLLTKLSNYTDNFARFLRLYETLSDLLEENKLKELFGADHKETIQHLEDYIKKVENFKEELKSRRKAMVTLKDEYLKIIEEAKRLSLKTRKAMELSKRFQL